MQISIYIKIHAQKTGFFFKELNKQKKGLLLDELKN